MEDWQIGVLIAVAVFIWAYKIDMKAPKPYRDRKCTGKKWKYKFPEISKEEIRLFLNCLVDGMAFDDSENLKFEPDDKIIDIYKSIYTGKVPIGDALECETFIENLSFEFNVKVEVIYDFWTENTTLEEMFQFILDHKVDTNSKQNPNKG